jgi:hypothetical protein
MPYKFICYDRNYEKYEVYNSEILEWLDISINELFAEFDPVVLKMMNQDIFDFDVSKNLYMVYSLNRCMFLISGVLCLEDGKTFGKVKDKKLYKCIPDDSRLPAFLVPYKLKAVGFDKKQVNKFVTFKFKDWDGKHPHGELLNVIGNVDIPENYYEYMLYCKSLNSSIENLKKRTSIALKKITGEQYINIIKNRYDVEDRTSWRVISIDPTGTRDIDDAFSVTDTEDGYCLSIYIANVPLWLDIMDLWSSLSTRISTIYLPDRKRPMISSILADDLCSLREGKRRVAFALDIFVNKQGKLLYYSFLNALINVDKNYGYDDEDVYDDMTFLRGRVICKHLNYRFVYNDKMITTHEVISYMMIIMNFMTARAFAQYKNGIFRKMKSNKNLKVPDNLPEHVKLFLKGWRTAGGTYTNFEDQEDHDFLGVDTYCHVTSPIRRLVDLLNLLQMMKNLQIIRDNLEADKFLKHWTSPEQIEYINTTMRAIRKVQGDCELIHMANTKEGFFDDYYQGYVFDRVERTDGLYQYLVYLPQLKHLTRYTSNEDKENYERRYYKLYNFKDESKLRNKIKLYAMEKEFRPEDYVSEDDASSTSSSDDETKVNDVIEINEVIDDEESEQGQDEDTGVDVETNEDVNEDADADADADADETSAIKETSLKYEKVKVRSSKTGYKGVQHVKKNDTYKVQVKMQSLDKPIYKSGFASSQEAAEWLDIYLVENNLVNEFGGLNIPENHNE